MTILGLPPVNNSSSKIVQTPMKKRTVALAVSLGLVSTFCVVKALHRRKQRRSSLRAQAAASFQEGKDMEGLEYLSKIAEPSPADLVSMASAHERLGNLFESSIILTHLIEFSPNTLEFIESRLRIHLLLGLSRPALKDMILLKVLEKDDSRSGELIDALMATSSLHAINHIAESHPSNILFDDFFETLFFLETLEDPVAVFIKSKEYSKCWQLVESSQRDIHKLIKGSMEYIKGNIERAIAILEDVKYQPGRAINIFLKAKLSRDRINTYKRCEKSKYFRNTRRPTEFKIELADELVFEFSEDPTTHYYLAKAYENLEIPEKQQFHLERLLSLISSAPGAVYQIISLIRSENIPAVIEAIKQSLEMYPENINLHCVSVEFFVHCQMQNEALEWLCNMERIGSKDPRTLLFKYVVGKMLGKPNINHLNAAIEADPLYFKTYVYLANHLTDNNEARKACRDALEHAHGFDEVFTACQITFFLEAHTEAKYECPSLFEIDN